MRRWEYDILMYLHGGGCGGIDWIDLVQDRDIWQALVNTVVNIRVV